jgi:hypothetical protein
MLIEKIARKTRIIGFEEHTRGEKRYKGEKQEK